MDYTMKQERAQVGRQHKEADRALKDYSRTHKVVNGESFRQIYVLETGVFSGHFAQGDISCGTFVTQTCTSVT